MTNYIAPLTLKRSQDPDQIEKAKERFWSKVDKSGDCWVWTAGKFNTGYGQFWLFGKCFPAHRVAYEEANGPIPDDLQLDHLCRNRACVNPSHLEAVDQRTNILRGNSNGARAYRTNMCKRGHPLSGPNLYVNPRGGRICRACVRLILEAKGK